MYIYTGTSSVILTKRDTEKEKGTSKNLIGPLLLLIPVEKERSNERERVLVPVRERELTYEYDLMLSL